MTSATSPRPPGGQPPPVGQPVGKDTAGKDTAGKEMPVKEMPGFRPLYRQVKDLLLQRMIDGVWPPGLALPSEGLLAKELGVSQGTVRKALDEMAAENLLVRRQGRGTFVAEHDERRILFQFFKLAPDEGPPSFPESRLLSAEEAPASEAERAALGLPEGARAIRIRRLRFIGEEPLILEDISLPESMFSGLAAGEIPNNLYALYATRFGAAIAHAHERLKAVSLRPDEAELLAAGPGEPALLIDRLALGLDGAAIEWRRSLCLTRGFHYAADLK